MAESAHVVSSQVPLAERGDTFSDYSLVGATMQYCSVIARSRREREIVTEGYLLSDLAYALIRYELKRSSAFPHLVGIVRRILSDRELQPDVYFILRARSSTITRRQEEKSEREKNMSEFFRKRYYTALEYLHRELDQGNFEVVNTDGIVEETLTKVMTKLGTRGLVRA